MRELLIRLLVGKHYIVVSNVGGVEPEAAFWSCFPIGREVLLINTYPKPKTEPAIREGK